MTNKLLPLEYCRIGRAARLLGCEVEDILHWASLGMIEACVFLSSRNVDLQFYQDGYHADDASRRGQLLDAIFGGTQHITGDERCPFMGKHSSMYRPHTHPNISNWSAAEQEWYKANSEGFANPANRVSVSGLWVLPSPAVESLILGKTVNMCDISIFSAGIEAPHERIVVLAEPTGYIGDVVEQDQVWIIKRDLDLLKAHIESGEALTKQSRSQAIQVAAASLAAISKPDGRAERHAVNRERVFAAAIFAKKEWPGECGDTARAWADTINQHSQTLFGEKDPPVAVEKMERLLSTAMTTGKPHKNT